MKLIFLKQMQKIEEKAKILEQETGVILDEMEKDVSQGKSLLKL